MTDKWIMQVPVLSTAHISQETNDVWLKEKAKCKYGHVHDLKDSGWLIWIGTQNCYGEDGEPLDEQDFLAGDAPKELLGIAKRAIEMGSTGWVRLDSAGMVLDGLKIFYW